MLLFCINYFLYTVYINDLCNVSSILKFVVFAGGTNIFCCADSLELLSNTISQELNKLHNWLAVKPKNCEITINQNIIERVYEKNVLT